MNLPTDLYRYIYLHWYFPTVVKELHNLDLNGNMYYILTLGDNSTITYQSKIISNQHHRRLIMTTKTMNYLNRVLDPSRYIK